MAFQLSAQKRAMDLANLTHSVAAEIIPNSSSNWRDNPEEGNANQVGLEAPSISNPFFGSSLDSSTDSPRR